MPLKRSVSRNFLSMREFLLAFGCCVLLLNHGSLGQDILFPEERPSQTGRVTKVTTTSTTTTTTTFSTSTISSTSTVTTPVPSIRCPENMTLTQVPNEKESYCECLVGNLHYPKLDRCFLQYTRGPCKEREHFILRANATVAECVDNPCEDKDTVLYKGSCHQLYVTGGPCDPEKTLTIPETSYGPECVEISAVNYQVITAPLKSCAPGSRRTSRGMCRQILR